MENEANQQRMKIWCWKQG